MAARQWAAAMPCAAAKISTRPLSGTATVSLFWSGGQHFRSRRGAHGRAGPGPRTMRSPTVRRQEKVAATAAAAAAAPGSGRRAPPVTSAAAAGFPENPKSLLGVFDKAIARAGSPLTAAQCVAAVAACKKVREAGVKITENVLQEYQVTPYELHAAATLLLFAVLVQGHRGVGDGRVTGQPFELAMYMLMAAALAPSRPGGYMPATLSLVEIIADARRQAEAAAARQPSSTTPAGLSAAARGIWNSPVAAKAEEKLLEYLSKNSTPLVPESAGGSASDEDVAMQANAFFQAGSIAEAAGNGPRALRWYRAARDVGQGLGPPLADAKNGQGGLSDDISPRPVRWDWERRCLVAIGRVQAQTQQSGRDRRSQDYQDARQSLRTAALALGSGEASWLLVREYADEYADETVSLEETELDVLLQNAAAVGHGQASEMLAVREEERARRISSQGDGGGKAKGILGMLGLGNGQEKRARFHRLLAAEWRRVAEAAAENARQGSQVEKGQR